MKTNLNTTYFLYNSHHKDPAPPLPRSLPANKKQYDGKMTLISRQLIYASTADDIFWVLHSKFQGERRLEYLL